MERTLDDIEGRYVVVPPEEGVPLATLGATPGSAADYYVREDGRWIPRIVVRPWYYEYPDAAEGGGFAPSDMRPLSPMPAATPGGDAPGPGISFADLVRSINATPNPDVWRDVSVPQYAQPMPDSAFDPSDMRPVAPMPSVSPGAERPGAGISYADLVRAIAPTANSAAWSDSPVPAQRGSSVAFYRSELRPLDPMRPTTPGAAPATPGIPFADLTRSINPAPNSALWDDANRGGGLTDTAKTIAKHGGIGMVRGGFELAGLPGDVQQWSDNAGAWALRKMGRPEEVAEDYKKGMGEYRRRSWWNPVLRRYPTSEEIKNFVEERAGKLPEPQTPLEEYSQTIGSFIPAAAAGPASAGRKLLLSVAGNIAKYGVVPGFASETAGQLTKGKPTEDLARGSAALLAMILAALASRRPRTSPGQPDKLQSKGGGEAGGVRGDADAKLYEPKAKPPTSAQEYYASFGVKPEVKQNQLLLRTPEGHLLNHDAVVIGHRTLTGGDHAITQKELENAIRGLLGSDPKRVATLGPRISGAYKDAAQRIYTLESLSALTNYKVLAHEFGHAIDHMSGWLLSGSAPRNGGPVSKIFGGLRNEKVLAELQEVYSTLRSGREGMKHPRGPDYFGYEPQHYPFEYIAEAMRAYLTNPNYLKTVAPNTAELLRRSINSHPTIGKVLQLNSVGGAVVGTGIVGAAATQGGGEEKY